jgi:hypothetical protein
MSKASEAGKSFLAGVLARLPEALRAQAEATFAAAEAESALEVLGTGALAQPEINRRFDEIKKKETELDAWHGQLTEWFEQKKTDLAELDALRAKPAPTPELRPNGQPTPNGHVDPSRFISREDFDKTLAAQERGALAFFDQLNQLSLRHFKDFGEVLNTTPLLTDRRLAQLGLEGIYQELHKEQLEARAKAAREAEVEKIRQEERTKLQAELAGQHHPYPVRGNEPSTLDGIEAQVAGKPPQAKTIDDMVAEYARLSAARTT